MATIKSYTSLEQSKKLAEFLPLESADMSYVWDYEHICYTPELFGFIQNQDNEGVEHIDYPCWSLAALLEQLPCELCAADGFCGYKIVRVMAHLIDKAAVVAEIEKRFLEDYNTDDVEMDEVAQGVLASLKFSSTPLK